MKIGVFGDSYAEKNYQDSSTPIIWYSFLKNYNHTVECFGESGSSILFSAELIKKHYQNYDLVIWCLTTPGRFSLPHTVNDRSYHVTTANDTCTSKDFEIITKHKVCVEYLKYIFDWESENLVSKSLVLYLQSVCKNLLIVPCFPPPLNADFNLYKLCEWEADFYFPGQSIPEIYQKYQDLRPGHITEENQKILAELINDKLTPGIFQTDYSNFIQPTLPIDKVFQKL